MACWVVKIRRRSHELFVLHRLCYLIQRGENHFASLSAHLKRFICLYQLERLWYNPANRIYMKRIHRYVYARQIQYKLQYYHWKTYIHQNNIYIRVVLYCSLHLLATFFAVSFFLKILVNCFFVQIDK